MSGAIFYELLKYYSERERYEQQKRELSKWHASLIAGRNINPDDVGMYKSLYNYGVVFLVH